MGGVNPFSGMQVIGHDDLLQWNFEIASERMIHPKCLLPCDPPHSLAHSRLQKANDASFKGKRTTDGVELQANISVARGELAAHGLRARAIPSASARGSRAPR